MEEKDLKVLPFWKYLSEEEKEKLSSQIRRVKFKKDQLIASTEFDCIGMLYVLSGLIRIYLYSEEGREVTVARLPKGEMCTLSASCIMSRVSFPAQIEAETDVEALLIPVKVFDSVKEKNVHVENYIYRLTAERFSDMISAVENMLFLTLEQRVVTFLLDETSRTKENTLNITQEKIAQAIGSAREAVSRILKQLSAAGYLEVSRGKIKLLDKKGLYGRI